MIKKFSLLLTIILFSVSVVSGFFVILSWRLGILKKEATLEDKTIDIRRQTEFINNYPYNTISNYVKDLPVQKIEFPSFQPEEIGRNSLF